MRYRYVLTLLLTLFLTACGGSGSGNGEAASGQPSGAVSGQPTAVFSELLRSDLKTSATAATVIKVSGDASAFKGATIEFPAGAVIEDAQLQVGYEDALPAPLRKEAMDAGATQVSKVLVLKITDGKDNTFNRPVVVTIPYDVKTAGDMPPAVFYFDETAQRYQAVSVIAVDRAAGTVSFRTSHFSKFVALALLGLGIEPEVSTGFSLAADSILHQNFGSSQFVGHCAAFASISTYYFRNQGAKRLYAFAQEGKAEDSTDDEITRSVLALTYGVIVNKWSSVIGSFLVPAAVDTGRLMLQSMIVTGQPLHLVIHDGAQVGHSVTVYGYDAMTKAFRIYDSNYPKTEVSFPWKFASGFGVYSMAGYPANMFDYIGYATDDTFASPGQFAAIVADWKSGKLADYFKNLSVTNPKDSVTKVLDAKADFTVEIPYEDGKTVQGQLTRPAASVNPVFLHVYKDGVSQGEGTLIGADGKFTINFPTKLENRVAVMLLVTESAASLTEGFTAFGRFTVGPPLVLRGSLTLISTTTTTPTPSVDTTGKTVVTVTINAPVKYNATRGELSLLSAGYSGSEVRESRSVTAIARSPCFVDAVTESVERTTITPRGPEFGAINFRLVGDNFELGGPSLPVTRQKTTTTRNSYTNARGDCSRFDFTESTRISESVATFGLFDPLLGLNNDSFKGSLVLADQGARSLVFSDQLLQTDNRFNPARSVTTSVQLTLKELPVP
jgi:hypothetical protein